MEYLALAFGAAWLLVGGFLGLLWRRERRLRRRIEHLAAGCARAGQPEDAEGAKTSASR